MNNKILSSILIITLFFLASCKKQKKFSDCNLQITNLKKTDYIDYYNKVYLADSLFIEENYSCSYEVLHNLFEEYGSLNMQVYYEYVTYLSSAVKLGKAPELCSELKELITKYGYGKERIGNYKELKEILGNCPNVKKNIDKLYEKFMSNIDIDLREEIYNMKLEDQKYRGNGTYRDNMEKQEAIDEYSSRRLIEIFDKYGYPNEKVIGDYSIGKTPVNIRAILLHTNDSIREHYFIPKLFEYVKEGLCDPKVFGTVVDQLHIYNGEPQVYGTYQNSQGSMSDVSDFEKLDSIRATIGLPKAGYEKWRRDKLYGEINIEEEIKKFKNKSN